MPIFEITEDRLVPLRPTGFSEQGLRERADLQRLLRDQIDVIAPDVLVISEEFDGWEDSKRRIDLLGVDREANLVVIELKRTEDGGHLEVQAIRYAAMVSKRTFDKGTAKGHLPDDASRPGCSSSTSPVIGSRTCAIVRPREEVAGRYRFFS